MSETAPPSLLRLTAQIVAAHVTHNSVSADALPGLIESVSRALAGSGAPPAAEPTLVPAVPIKRSVFPDHIVCLEDGKRLQMLKRHLMTSYGMTPDQYRQKSGLPPSYPMVAPDYAERRSALAKEIGLGRKASAKPEERAAKTPARRGRPPGRKRDA